MLGIPVASTAPTRRIAERLGVPPAPRGRSRHGAVGAASSAAGLAARAAVRYKAEDFSISRQRSWGTPIPIVYCEELRHRAARARTSCRSLLPLDITPDRRRQPAGRAAPSSSSTTCPPCGGPARRETDTLDCHFDALWLWVPACVPPEAREEPLEEILALADLRHWLPSERVVAGSDSGNFVFDQRIVTKALRDIGPLAFLPDGEPFAGCLFHEMVISDGRKMSKHLGNVVDPDAARRALRRRHGAPRRALRGAPAEARSTGATPPCCARTASSRRCGSSRRRASPPHTSWTAAAARAGASGGGGGTDGDGEPDRDTSEHLRLKLVQWPRRASRRSPRTWRASRCTARCAT